MNAERGFALIWAMFLMVLVAAASSTLFTRSSTLLAESETKRMQHGSFWAAEGGLEATRHAVAADPEHTGGTIEVGEFRAVSSVTRTMAGWRVEVHATPGGARISAELASGKGLPKVANWQSR